MHSKEPPSVGQVRLFFALFFRVRVYDNRFGNLSSSENCFITVHVCLKGKRLVFFTSDFVLSIAVLPHRPGVVYYHLLLRKETRIPGFPPSFFE